MHPIPTVMHGPTCTCWGNKNADLTVGTFLIAGPAGRPAHRPRGDERPRLLPPRHAALGPRPGVLPAERARVAMRAVEPFGRRVAYVVRRIPGEISPYGRSEYPSGAKSYAMSFRGHHLGTGSRDMSIIFHW